MDGAYACFCPFQNAPLPNSFSYRTKTSSTAPPRHNRPRTERSESQNLDRLQQAAQQQAQFTGSQKQRRSQQPKLEERLENAAARPRPEGSSGQALSSQSTGEVQQQQQQHLQEASETILTFRRDGEGWGEAILPRIVFQSRPLETRENLKHRVRSRCSRPAPWQPGSAEIYLRDTCEVPTTRIDRVMAEASAWRITPNGRILVDRRRRSRVERNLTSVVEYLVNRCGLPPGVEGVGAIFMRSPKILLCKPTLADRWDRRCVEFAAFRHQHGHGNVPLAYEDNPELAAWAKRQRMARTQNSLSDERLQVLASAGFEFGELGAITNEWEDMFDQLLEWLMVKPELADAAHPSWLGLGWGLEAGLRGRQVGLWAQLLRETHARGLLQTEAVCRLEAIGFRWSAQGHGEERRKWAKQLGKLIYAVEHQRALLHEVVRQAARDAELPLGLEELEPPLIGDEPTYAIGCDPLPGQHYAHDLATWAVEGGSSATGMGVTEQHEQAAGEEDASLMHFSPLSGDSQQLELAVPNSHEPGQPQQDQQQQSQQLQVMAQRQSALRQISLGPGMNFWLAKQRRLWRLNRLPRERQLLLQLAGLDMNTYHPLAWQRLAHEAATRVHAIHTHLEQQQSLRWVPVGRSHSRKRQGMQQQQRAPCVEAAQAQKVRARQAVMASKQPRGGCSVLEHDVTSGPQYPSHSQHSDTEPLEWGRESPAAWSPEGHAMPHSLAAADSGEVQLEAGQAGPHRLAVGRWILTQKVLHQERRLSAGQHRYLSLLGLSWLVSSKVAVMGRSVWRQHHAELQAWLLTSGGRPPSSLPHHLAEWLRYQQTVHELGLLESWKQQALQSSLA
ncbi:hypothetical protein WJX74_003003 [Apatococcus lobatus]|uniref:Helicase-associated domain-containing protein n=1 Tax=Apatococcus lobatus TaxID=904363 RepID=A0AAW1RQF8_9CHLO